MCYLLRYVTSEESVPLVTEEADNETSELPEFSAKTSESASSVNITSEQFEKNTVSIGCESELSLTL